jgi:hypothetical protein
MQAETHVPSYACYMTAMFCFRSGERFATHQVASGVWEACHTARLELQGRLDVFVRRLRIAQVEDLGSHESLLRGRHNNAERIMPALFYKH